MGLTYAKNEKVTCPCHTIYKVEVVVLFLSYYFVYSLAANSASLDLIMNDELLFVYKYFRPALLNADVDW